MIAVAEEFLHAVEDAFDATDMARRTVKTRLEGSETPNSDSAARDALAEADAKTRAVDRLIPRLDMIFPEHRLRGRPSNEAFQITTSLERLRSLLEGEVSRSDADEAAYEDAIGAFHYAHGRFTGYTNAVIWARWHNRLADYVRAFAGRLRPLKAARPRSSIDQARPPVPRPQGRSPGPGSPGPSSRRP